MYLKVFRVHIILYPVGLELHEDVQRNGIKRFDCQQIFSCAHACTVRWYQQYVL